MNPDGLIYMIAGLYALAVFIYVFTPGPDDGAIEAEKTRLSYLYERKEVIYENLRDLNFEHKSGKFTEDDFEAMRANMEAEAARLLAEIATLETAKA